MLTKTAGMFAQETESESGLLLRPDDILFIVIKDSFEVVILNRILKILLNLKPFPLVINRRIAVVRYSNRPEVDLSSLCNNAHVLLVNLQLRPFDLVLFFLITFLRNLVDLLLSIFT